MSVPEFKPLPPPGRGQPGYVPRVVGAHEFLRDSNRELVAKQLRDMDARTEARKRAQPQAVHVADLVSERSTVAWQPGCRGTLEREVLALLVGTRGTYKTAIAHRWAFAAALAGVPVFVCDGEPAGTDRRFAALAEQHKGADLAALPIHVMRRRLNLTTDEGRALLRAELQAVQFKGGILILDTYSKFSAGLDANDNSAVSEFVGHLADFRTQFACTVLLIAHTGHSDQTRARGASSLTDDTDSAFVVTREGGSVVVTRERFKGSASLPPLHYAPRVVDLGYRDSEGEPATGIVLDTREPPRAAGASNTASGMYEPCIFAALRAAGADGLTTRETLDIVRDNVPRDPEDVKDNRRIKGHTRAIASLISKGLAEAVAGSDGERTRARVHSVEDVPDFLS